VTFADHGATAMIYGLIRSCNRSQPHVELVVTALSILKNLSSHESTIYALIEPKEAIEVLLETCQNFRDKQRIFALGVVLLEIIWRKMHPLIVSAMLLLISILYIYNMFHFINRTLDPDFR
jgi:abnormal spindle-like microcephaly-associated protein